jgi:probable O-glycosylation ligase (exosortase A-associated)
MPDNWSERMSTIQTYDEDKSALGSFSAWWVSWRIGLNYPFGVGFNISRPELFAAYSPYPELGTPVAHSIYFQMLGNHGFVGLFLFLGIWFTTLVYAQRVRKIAKGIPQAQWCVDLAGMCQVSIIGYLVGGTFLNLAYFDLPYYVMAAVVLTHQWVTKKAWLTEPVYQKRWFSMPGLATSTSSR